MSLRKGIKHYRKRRSEQKKWKREKGTRSETEERRRQCSIMLKQRFPCGPKRNCAGADVYSQRNCHAWRGHTGTEDKCGKEEVAEKKCYILIVTPTHSSFPTAFLGEVEQES